MQKYQAKYHCLVCGYPFGIDMGDITDGSEICDSCGCGIGYNDWRLQDAKEHRQKWLDTGKQWWSPTKHLPENWNPDEQMKNIPAEWL